ncbi:MAG: c-type cytochrome [Ardenticatenaceae bacterium]|nr:c-type cytochrome [Anaerolineales bacterium]MCB8923600.1 c-type cytochrome [Ardenticatenaceae bacterium]MCB9003540.1 c-type cytochrome [Ardenticatenaceae bacterium]
MRKTLLILLVILSMLLLVACGGGGDEEAADAGSSIGNAANGEKLFNQVTIGTANAPGCVTCHSLEPDVVLTGPSQYDVAVRAVGRVPGMSAEDYIHESIVNPDAYVVEGFEPGVMYQNFGTELSESEINDLVAYFMTLDGK